jgi:hypothetical protein
VPAEMPAKRGVVTPPADATAKVAAFRVEQTVRLVLYSSKEQATSPHRSNVFEDGCKEGVEKHLYFPCGDKLRGEEMPLFLDRVRWDGDLSREQL